MTVSEHEWAACDKERRAASEGDMAAWAALFTWLWIWTVQLAGSEDGAMEGWLKVIRNPRLWLNYLGSFVLIFKNAGRDARKKERRHQGRIEAFRASGATGVQSASDAEVLAILAQALDKLPNDDQRVTMLYFEGFSYAEISKLCALPYATARVRVRAVLVGLREVLRRENGGEGWAAPAV